MALGEFDIIEQYFRQNNSGQEGVDRYAPEVILGIGDDAALFEIPSDHQLAITVDTLVADVHFPAGIPGGLLAERSLRVNLSDLAAMGAKPSWITLALTLPELKESWLRDFSQTLQTLLTSFGIRLAGGDTTRGPLTVTIQAHGLVPKGQALLRSGASVGDRICVTGPLGDAAAALECLWQSSLPESVQTYLRGRYYQPRPCLEEGILLREFASAALDISDGLLADLGHICKASGVGACLDAQKIPLSAALREHFGGDEALRLALTGGDDYQLCFTLPPSRRDALGELFSQQGLQFIDIGEVVAGDRVEVLQEGEPLHFVRSGYEHF